MGCVRSAVCPGLCPSARARELRVCVCSFCLPASCLWPSSCQGCLLQRPHLCPSVAAQRQRWSCWLCWGHKPPGWRSRWRAAPLLGQGDVAVRAEPAVLSLLLVVGFRVLESHLHGVRVPSQVPSLACVASSLACAVSLHGVSLTSCSRQGAAPLLPGWSACSRLGGRGGCGYPAGLGVALCLLPFREALLGRGEMCLQPLPAWWAP